MFRFDKKLQDTERNRKLWILLKKKEQSIATVSKKLIHIILNKDFKSTILSKFKELKKKSKNLKYENNISLNKEYQ